MTHPQIFLWIFQGDQIPDLGGWGQYLTLIAIIGAWIVRELFPKFLELRKSRIEAKTADKKNALEARSVDIEEAEKVADRFFEAIDKVVEVTDKNAGFTDLLLKEKEEKAEISAKLFLFEEKEKLWKKKEKATELEIKQLEKSLKLAGAELDEKNKIIVDLRDELQQKAVRDG